MIRPTTSEARMLGVSVFAVVGLALLPLIDQGYFLAMGVNLMLYAALATAWSLFSGPTHLVSLATAAFYGVGTYAVGLGTDVLPFGVLVVIGGLAAALLAGIVGAATLRLSGVYFVIFTFGLAELIRQVVSWSQAKATGSVGLYVFTDFGEEDIYWMLLALTVAVFVTGWLIGRSRPGFALEVIGNDETVGKHIGIDTARVKIVLFMISGAFIAMAGAIVAPRYSYIEPGSAFNPMISFLVVIMALMGGTRRLWGALVGVVPFTVTMDVLTANFASYTNVVLGLAFLVIVYLLPNGVTGRLEQLLGASRRRAGTSETVGFEGGAS